MDTTVNKIIGYSRAAMKKGPDSEEKELIKMRIADSLITAFGAKDSDPVKILRRSLLPSSGKLNSSVYFSRDKGVPYISTFINGCMTRYLDFNDTYLSKEALHPSDNIPPVISIAEVNGLGGMDIIRGIKIAYDVVCSLADATSIRDRGWDHVNYDSISSAAALASLMNLSDEKFENALSLSIINNVSMRQTRAGKLSMWKGCTVAYSTMASVFAALNASDGLTGPSDIFEGEMGFKKEVSGPFNLEISPHVKKTMIKNYPVEYHAMSAAQAASILKKQVKGEIRRINVETFTVANTIIIKDPEKLRPENKETADHSMPYIIAYTLLYGDPVINSYDHSFLKDPKILSLIDRMKFTVTKKFDGMYPEYLPVKISVEDEYGTHEEEVDVPKGHFRDPYSWDDLMAKALRVNERLRPVVSFVKDIENKNADELMEVVRSVADA